MDHKTGDQWSLANSLVWYQLNQEQYSLLKLYSCDLNEHKGKVWRF